MAVIFSKNTFSSIIEGWAIHPENNVVPGNILETLKKNNYFHTQMKMGKYTIQKTSTDSKNIDDSHLHDNNSKIVNEILNMKPSEAKKIILGDGKDNNGLLDIFVLKDLQQKDMRSGIQKAIENRIELLYSRDEEEEENK